MEVENEHSMIAHAPKDSNTYKNSQHGTAKQTHKFTFSHVSVQGSGCILAYHFFSEKRGYLKLIIG